MKKLFTAMLLTISNSTLAICDEDSVLGNWHASETISGYGLAVVSVCRMGYEEKIKFLPSDLLNKSGSIAVNNNSPQVSNAQLSSSNITIRNTMPFPSTSFKMPTPFYLQKDKNNRETANGELGLFRFYTEIFKPWRCETAPLGFKHIRSIWYYNFFKNMKVNGKNIVLTNEGGSFAVARDVILRNKKGGRVSADLYLIEGRNKQRTGSLLDMCIIDVYVHLQLKPDLLSQSGSYKLQFKHQ
ncbi:Uncharacterised protein [Phocoenobacter uteri]|uniref:Uncharacterized protein n=1 Tax=Phocoenobacter uteri TaxID=146806 RepID=A0A379C8M8_9PAST|nr:hypothetical protein [Phocoenobacter uteri]MDG6882502.1 hypothetical protein [Phocoenobacter uteri]SUB58663.1 Uncharacterised protein [Phocoenobacter uteri]